MTARVVQNGGISKAPHPNLSKSRFGDAAYHTSQIHSRPPHVPAGWPGKLFDASMIGVVSRKSSLSEGSSNSPSRGVSQSTPSSFQSSTSSASPPSTSSSVSGKALSTPGSLTMQQLQRQINDLDAQLAAYRTAGKMCACLWCGDLIRCSHWLGACVGFCSSACMRAYNLSK